jgi:hypothetical protein
MEGLVMKDPEALAMLGCCTAPIYPLMAFDACCAMIERHQLKKGAVVRLTSPERLRHNPFTRKYVHGEKSSRAADGV